MGQLPCSRIIEDGIAYLGSLLLVEDMMKELVFVREVRVCLWVGGLGFVCWR